MLTVTVTSISHMTNVIAFKEDERRNTTNSYLRSHPHKHQTYKYEHEYTNCEYEYTDYEYK